MGGAPAGWRIDGIDAAPFLRGQRVTTGRDTYLFFGLDGALMSVKWKIYRTIFRYTNGLESPIVQPQFPLFFDLSSDPHEDFNLFVTKMDNGWLLAPVFRAIRAYQQRVARSPNIQPGEEFTGYS